MSSANPLWGAPRIHGKMLKPVDFAKLVELFEGHGVSLVSVPWPNNTAESGPRRTHLISVILRIVVNVPASSLQ